MVRLSRAAAICALAVGLLAVRGGAQSPPAGQSASQPAPQPPVFKTGINFVRVDAIITDASGNTVADLKPEDFEIVEDGKAQKIETFKLVKLDGGAADARREAPIPIRSDAVN